MKRLALFALPLLLLALTCRAADDDACRVARIFSDNMVLQQGKPVPIWGWAAPGDSVHVVFRGKQYGATADGLGKWQLRIDPSPAGGPYELTVRCGTSLRRFVNVLVGEVWLAAGQSNMNFRMSNVLNAAAEISAADFPEIREFATPNRVSRVPLEDLADGSWRVCSPQDVGDFSAVAYYFARALYLDRKVPVGIIHTSWSGTICESWISAEALHAIPEFRNRVEREVYDNRDDWQRLQSVADSVGRVRERLFQEPGPGLEAGAHRPDFDDTAWQSVSYPVSPAAMGLPGYRLLWLRKEVELSCDAARRDLSLCLGKVMTGSIVYFNGREIGRHRWDGIYEYAIPAGLAKPGRNVIAVKLLSEWGNGRLGDARSDPSLSSRDGEVCISLRGAWRCNAVLEPRLPVAKGLSNNLSCMYNTKIAPLEPYALRGFLWYQGEGNSGRPDEYGRLQPALISDWRARFGQGRLPFLFVQLPNIARGHWAEFRQVQSESLAVPGVGMAVAIDVGDPYDIHPVNKRPVGERLYLRARELVYGDRNGVFQGPCPDSVWVERREVRLRFRSVGAGLVSRDGEPLRAFEVAGADSCFHPATARIEGRQVVVRCEEVAEPRCVRYAWSSDPAVNLYNREGLPAGPFRLWIP